MYFIGSYGRGAARAIAALLAAAEPSRVRYLGRAGLTSLHGLSVAFLDGMHDGQAYQRDMPAGYACRHFCQASQACQSSR
jgi:hypothetical protein